MPTLPVIVGRQTEVNAFTPHSPVEVVLTQDIPVGTLLVLLSARQYEINASGGAATDDAGNLWAAIGDETQPTIPGGSWAPAYKLLACEVQSPLSTGQKVYADVVSPGDPVDVLIVALVAGEYEWATVTVGMQLLIDAEAATFDEAGLVSAPSLDPALVTSGPGILIGGLGVTFTAPTGGTVTLDPAYTSLGQVNYGQYVGVHLAYHQPFYRQVAAGSYVPSVTCSPNAYRWSGSGIILLEANPVVDPPPDPDPEPVIGGGGIGTSETGGECGATGGFSVLSGGEPATSGGYSLPIEGCV